MKAHSKATPGFCACLWIDQARGRSGGGRCTDVGAVGSAWRKLGICCGVWQTPPMWQTCVRACLQTSREDAAAAAQAELQAQWAAPQQTRAGDGGALGLDTFIIYRSHSGNMLTPANLDGMRSARPNTADHHRAALARSPHPALHGPTYYQLMDMGKCDDVADHFLFV